MLSNFGSYFEIFTVLNLGYATSKIFRNVVDSEILKMSAESSPVVKSKVNEINAKINTHKLDSNNVDSKIISIEKKFEKDKKDIIDNARRYKDFPIGQRPMFLITTLFCFAVLVIGGCEAFFSCDRISLRIVRFLSYSVLGFNLIIFVRSFDPLKNNKEIPPLATIFLFSLFSLIPIWACCKFPISDTYNQNFVFYNLGLPIIVAFSPYLLHFIRAFINQAWYSLSFILAIRRCNKELKTIENALKALFSD